MLSQIGAGAKFYVFYAVVVLPVFLVRASAMDLDTGLDAVGLVKATESWELGAESTEPRGWVRLRGVVEPQSKPETGNQKPEDDVQATREALQKLRERGLKTCVLLRWKRNAENGELGARSKYLPEDLREAYANGRKLGAVYGGFVDAWEVDNEPDLGAVPETAENYAAFLKATYLGLKAGGRELRTGGKDPRVIMGALGLPPGPWCERFAANDGFSYTDGFNYHYYGYADDFSGVYRQQEAAVKELSGESYQLSGVRPNNQESLTNNLRRKNLPVFLTEIGYGMLGKNARDTKEGRLRQWRWFRSVGQQTSSLRIEAPMAFYLPPYLEYDTLEFGLTVPSAGVPTSDRGLVTKDKWMAGGIEYVAKDFGAKATEPWMKRIGQKIGGYEATPALAWWLATRHPEDRGQKMEGGKSWTINVAAPSPVVVDFIAGEGLSPIKRYNGAFLTGKSPGQGAGSKEPVPGKPATSSQQTSAPHSEEFMIHVRTANGNLYEVYPTRQATPEWQSYSEAQGNFTASFYGRAELPWRFKDNRPASLVVVMYPKQLPAVYEFRRMQLVKIGQAINMEAAERTGKVLRYGHGKIVLYNFSEKPVSGRLVLPREVTTEDTELLRLASGERREIPVTIKTPWERFERIEAPITFVPEDRTMPVAHFMTAFIPDIGGMKTTAVAGLIPQGTGAGGQWMATSNQQPAADNRSFISSRPRATEEAPMTEQGGFFTQQGARVKLTSDGFIVTVTETPPGKQQRIELEFPWPEGQVFSDDVFLSFEYRLIVGL